MNKDLQILIKALKKLQSNPKPYNAICASVKDTLLSEHMGVDQRIKILNLLSNAFTQWPKTSGDHFFPIEGNFERYCVHNETRWDPTTKYGALRHELLDWLITYFETKEQELCLTKSK